MEKSEKIKERHRNNISLSGTRKGISPPPAFLHSPNEKLSVLQHSLGNYALQRLLTDGILQAKLNIGQANDKYEQEASKIADRVVAQKERCRGEISSTAHNNADQVVVAREMENELVSERNAGQPLTDDNMLFFNSSFGMDFSGVRLHHDQRAAEMNKRINAKAFTFGKNIYLNDDYGSLAAAEKQKLLAHEMVHVVQQSKESPSGLLHQNAPMTNRVQRQAKGENPPDLIASDQPGSIASQVPKTVGLINVSLSFTIPADTEVSGGWHDISTAGTTTARLTITDDALQISFFPGLIIDLTYPASDVSWSGITFNFFSGMITDFQLYDTQSWAPLTAICDVKQELCAFFSKVMKGTPPFQMCSLYNPLNDPNIAKTLSIIKGNIESMESSKSELKPSDISNVTLSANVYFTEEIKVSAEEGGVFIPKGGRAYIGVTLSGNAEELLKGSEIKISYIEIDSDSIIIQQDGSDVAKLQQFKVLPGGKIFIQKFELMGTPGKVAVVESLAKFVILLLALKGGQPSDRLALIDKQPHLEPELTYGVAGKKMEEALSKAIMELIKKNCFAIPHVNLCKMLDIPGP